MSATANLLYSLGFDGADTPGVVDPWPGFEFPIEKWDYSLNPQSGAQSGINGVPLTPYVNEPFIPVIDGQGHGVGGVVGQTWRLRATSHPGRANFQADLWAKFRNPAGFGSNAAVGLLVRCADAKNTISARISLDGSGGAPTLRLVQIVAGVETVLDSYTGAGLTNAMLAAGVAWRIRCEDAGANSILTVFVGPDGGASKGTQRIAWDGVLPAVLRGSLPTGVELIRAPSAGNQATAWVDNHEVYDLADESAEDDPGDGSGWTLEIDGVNYTRAQLAAFDPPIRSFSVWQGFGPDGCGLRIVSEGDWVMKAGLRPGLPVRAFHHGKCRFRGTLMPGTASATLREAQVWEAYDATWLAGLVTLEEDDGTPTHTFNVYDEESDLWRDDRQEMTIGDVIAFLAERYGEELRRVGAAPQTLDMFVTSELTALDAVIPDLAISGTFQAAIFQLIGYMRKYQPFVDPLDGRWHFRDLTAARQEAISCQADWVQPKRTADPRKSFTRVRIVGSAKEEDAPVTLKLSDGSLKPAWTTPQQALSGKHEQRKGEFAGFTSSGGAEVFEGVMRTYLVLAGAYGIKDDEWRGAIESIASSGQFVVGNKNVGGATRVYLGPSAWPGGIPPAPGTPFLLTMLDKQAMKHLSDIGVGRAFYVFRPITTCGGGGKSSLYDQGIGRGQACGSAFIKGRDPDSGRLYAEEYDMQVYGPTAKAMAAGFCNPVAVIANKPKPPISLINFFRDGSPPGSSPLSGCQAGSTPGMPQGPNIDVELVIKKKKGKAPEVSTPSPTTWSGPAYDDWDVKRTKTISFPDFVDQAAQGPGLQKACDAVHAILSQKAELVEIVLATPWQPHHQFVLARHAQGYASEQWAGLTAGVTVSSSRRSTGLEGVTNLPVYRVEWDVMGNRTILQAGTAAGWLNVDAEQIARAFTEKGLLAKTARLVKDALQDLSCLLRKPIDRVGAASVGPTPGCEVPVIDSVRRTVKSVEEDDEQKKDNIAHLGLKQHLSDILDSGLQDTEFPGSQIEMPGFDGPEGKQVGKYGRVLQSLPESPLQGASRYANGGRGRYGGPIASDESVAGQPPDEVARFAWGVVRKRADGNGSNRGGYDLEWSPLDAQGAPTGAWNPLNAATDLNAGAGPHLKYARKGSQSAQLRDRTDVIADVVGLRKDDAGRILDPAAGPGSTPFNDGPPADYITALLVAATASAHLWPRLDTLDDPGGLVFEGPKSVDGADAGCLWQVVMPERLLVKVTDVGVGGAGARNGAQGGRFAPDTAATPAGTVEVLKRGDIVHKQAEAMGGDLGNVGVNPLAAVPIADDSPFGFLGPGGAPITAGWAMGAIPAVFSGVGARLEMPAYSRGTPMFTFHFMEDPFAAGPAAGGALMGGVVQYAYQASPWSGITASAPAPVLVTAPNPGPAFPAKGVFLLPGGAVPPGLRRAFGLAVAFQRQPGVPGVDGGAGALILQAIGVDIAVTETGFAAIHRVSGVAAVTTKDNQPWKHELVAVGESATFRYTHRESRAVLAFEASARGQTDPPYVSFEDVSVAIVHACFLDLVEQGEAVGVGVAESWDLY